MFSKKKDSSGSAVQFYFSLNRREGKQNPSHKILRYRVVGSGHTLLTWISRYMDQVNRLKSRTERRLSPLNPMAGSFSPSAGSPLSSVRVRTPPVAALSRPSSSVASSPSKPQLESSVFLGSHPMLISAHSSPSKSSEHRSHSFDPGNKLKELSKPLSYKRFVQYDTTDSESDFSLYEKELNQDVTPEHMSNYLFKTSLSCPEMRALDQLDILDKKEVKKESSRVRPTAPLPSSPRSFNGKN
jgi:hypothetical protein